MKKTAPMSPNSTMRNAAFGHGERPEYLRLGEHVGESTPRVRAVTFDLWMTLIWDTEELDEYWKFRRLVNLHRFVNRRTPKTKPRSDAVTFNSVRLAVEEMGERAESIYKSGRDISPEVRGEMIFDILGIRLAYDEAPAVYEQTGRILSRSGYFSRFPHLNVEARPTLERLKEDFPGIKIGLISNAARSGRTYQRMLQSFGIAQYFDAITISCEAGFLKPRREIFDANLHALSVEPSEALHVGDSFKADVVGAVSMGMNAALYTGLWHRYRKHHHAVGEHIPKGFEPSKSVDLKEISSLREVLGLVRELG